MRVSLERCNAPVNYFLCYVSVAPAEDERGVRLGVDLAVQREGVRVSYTVAAKEQRERRDSVERCET